jgi:LysM repeat protein
MKRLVRLWNGVMLAVLALAWTGCDPATVSNQTSEEKEPHYLAGKSRVNAMDFKGAIESFEKAIESNPSNAAAHFELGWLFDRKEGDPAAAIYHYEKFLKLRPKAENSEIVHQHIQACKQELARTVTLGPINDRVQKELERLTEDNKKLREENKTLNEEALKWRTYFAAAAATNRAAMSASESSTPRDSAARDSSRRDSGQKDSAQRSVAKRQATPDRTATPRSTTTLRSSNYGSGRTHVVRSGETLTSIARRYGVKLSTLTWANPGVDPKRLKAGQVIKIP